MTRLRVLTIVGTRPEAIKMAPVILALQRRSERFESRVCATAQHRQMLDQVLGLFDIRPQYDLNLMRDNQSLAEITASVFTGIDRVLRDEKPDWVLVQGDTTTVMATALTAYYHKIHIGHVEAGLRTHDKYQPFPEEINRKVAGAVADAHFAPTRLARENLLAEGVPADTIQVTGNPVVDALLLAAQRPFDMGHSPLAGLPADLRWVLVTAHRRESFGAPLEQICEAIRDLAERFRGDVHFLYPVHLNPNVGEPVRRLLGNIPNITLLPPLDYLPMVNALKRSELVLTDSGGLQEEAPALGKPVLVLREVTERPEGIEAGTARLVGTDRQKIIDAATRLLTQPVEYEKMAHSVNPYGDGHAAERIVDWLEQV
jgi:UDP-N-acetylglucosamine 2-epimerase (non-hydrolysing)